MVNMITRWYGVGW